MRFNQGLFYGPIFIAFGLGLYLSKNLPHTDGFYYMAIGFIVLIIAVLFANVATDEGENKNG